MSNNPSPTGSPRCTCDAELALQPCEKCKNDVRACLGASFDSVSSPKIGEIPERPQFGIPENPHPSHTYAASRNEQLAGAGPMQATPPPQHVLRAATLRRTVDLPSVPRIRNDALLPTAQKMEVPVVPSMKVSIGADGASNDGTRMLINNSKALQAALHNAYIEERRMHAATAELSNRVQLSLDLARSSTGMLTSVTERAEKLSLKLERRNIIVSNQATEIDALRAELESVTIKKNQAERTLREDTIVHDAKSLLCDRRSIELDKALDALNKTRAQLTREQDERRAYEHSLMQRNRELEDQVAKYKVAYINLNNKRPRTE